MQDAVNSFSNLVLQAVLPVLVSVAAGFAAVLIKQAAAYFKANVDAKTQAQLEWLAGVVVQAAEQSDLSGQLVNYGNDKKAWAIAQLQALLAQYKLPALDLNALSALVEAEVWKQFNQYKTDSELAGLKALRNKGN
jgi:hypothetical protein